MSIPLYSLSLRMSGLLIVGVILEDMATPWNRGYIIVRSRDRVYPPTKTV